jgi:DnaK suppressor protein
MLPLNPNQLQILREKLQTQLSDIETGATQRQESSATVALDQTSVGRLSRMDAIQQQAFGLAAARRAEEQKLRLRAALRRIDESAYGNCIDCEEPIGIQRLVADPCALLCLDCQKDRDEQAAAEERRRRVLGRSA